MFAIFPHEERNAEVSLNHSRKIAYPSIDNSEFNFAFVEQEILLWAIELAVNARGGLRRIAIPIRRRVLLYFYAFLIQSSIIGSFHITCQSI